MILDIETATRGHDFQAANDEQLKMMECDTQPAWSSALYNILDNAW